MKYALELTVKFDQISDVKAKEFALTFLSSLETLAGLPTMLGLEGNLFELDEIRLVDDDFYRAYGEHRFIELIADPTEEAGENNGGEQEGIG